MGGAGNIFRVNITRVNSTSKLNYSRPHVFSNENISGFGLNGERRPGTYLGIGGLQNLDQISIFRPGRAVIVDIDNNVCEHLSAFRSTLKVAENPVAFLAMISSTKELAFANSLEINNNDQLLTRLIFNIFDTSDAGSIFGGATAFAKRNLAAVSGLLGQEEYLTLERIVNFEADSANFYGTGNDSLLKSIFTHGFSFNELWNGPQLSENSFIWLKDLQAYSYLRELALNDRIAVINGDIADISVISAMNRSLRELPEEKADQISTCYLSDVDQFIFKNGMYGRYMDSLSAVDWDQNMMVLRTFLAVSNIAVRGMSDFRFTHPDLFFYQKLAGEHAAFMFREEPRSYDDLIFNSLLASAKEYLKSLAVDSEYNLLTLEANAANFFGKVPTNDLYKYVHYLDFPPLIRTVLSNHSN